MNISPHKFLKLRHRYVFTRANSLRLRYMVGGFAAVCALGVTAHAALTPDYADMPIVPLEAPVAVDMAENAGLPENLQDKISGAMRLAPGLLKKAEKPPYETVEIKSGQTIAGVLQKGGLSGRDAFFAVKALTKHFDPRRVKAGQKMTLHYTDPNGARDFEKMVFTLSPVKEIIVARNDAGDFVADLNEKELQKRTYGRFAEIETSLYGSAARADIPSPVIAEMIRIYSWDVDFQRDIRQGDKVKVLYEAFETEDGSYSKNGNILYASLEIGGKEVPIYRFEMADGRIDYFEPNGTSIRKTLMKTPVDGARISSGFGMRKHPVLGYNKMHKGMDFAAPTGTPIYAAGDGVVEFVGRKGGYGNYIRVRHNSKLKTAYAHLHKFKKGMRNGRRVEQGDVIGYVGTTGRSTGPHLHYEVHVNGKQVNPRSVDLPTGEILQGEQLRRFKSARKNFDQEYAALTRGHKFALFGDPDNS
ncbi:MAG: peptidoglycan DD-metalloendopeptidase family protein [Alphaproteobacteria bacterium]